MDASIIICSFNQSHVLPHVLRSLREQDTKHGFEVIVTDDGSTNDHIARTYDTFQEFDDLQLFHVYQQDRGFNAARARNNAIRLARNAVVVTLDGDIIPDSKWLDATLKPHADSDRLITYAHRTYKDFDEVGKNESASADNKALHQVEIDVKKHMKAWQRAWSFNISFKKSDETYFDEGFRNWGLEDGEFCYRLIKQHEYELCELMDANVCHINDVRGQVDNPFRTKAPGDMLNFIDNALYFYDKYGDPEIMETFNTVPNFDQFISPEGFSLSQMVASPIRQSRDNLAAQRKLFAQHLGMRGAK